MKAWSMAGEGGGYDAPEPHEEGGIVMTALQALGVRSAHLRAVSMGSILLCVGLWIRAKTVDQEARGNAERRALFVGLWPPMFWLISEALEERE